MASREFTFFSNSEPVDGEAASSLLEDLNSFLEREFPSESLIQFKEPLQIDFQNTFKSGDITLFSVSSRTTKKEVAVAVGTKTNYGVVIKYLLLQNDLDKEAVLGFLFEKLREYGKKENITIYLYSNVPLISNYLKNKPFESSTDNFPDFNELFPNLADLQEGWQIFWIYRQIEQRSKIENLIDPDEKYVVKVLRQTGRAIESVEVLVELNLRIGEIFAQIGEDVNEKEFQLIFAGQVLDARRKVAEYEIGKQAELLLVSTDREFALTVQSTPPSGAEFEVKVNASYTVEFVKQLISFTSRRRVLKVTFEESILEDNTKTLEEYNVAPGSKLIVEVKFSARADEPMVDRRVVVPYGTNRRPTGIKDNPYDGYNDFKLHQGICEVFVPKDHEFGTTESSSYWVWLKSKLGGRSDSSAIQIEGHQEMEQQDFLNELKNYFEKQESNKDYLLFIHGFNVDFNGAIRRTAQLAVDLNFKGVVGSYSWPSKGTLDGYVADGETVVATVEFYIQYLKLIVQGIPEGGKLHIISHSMGNRLTTQSLAKIRTDTGILGKLGNLIYAAPDVDQRFFFQLVDGWNKSFEPKLYPSTVYACPSDRALTVSAKFHKAFRFGQDPSLIENAKVILVNQDIQGYLDWICSKVNVFATNHGYIYECEDVVDHLKIIMHQSQQAEEEILIPPNDDCQFFRIVFKKQK